MLVRKVAEPRVLDLVRGLCDKVVTITKKDQSRDIASIGLKTVIEVASGSLAHPVSALISGKMLEGVQQKVSTAATTSQQAGTCCKQQQCVGLGGELQPLARRPGSMACSCRETAFYGSVDLDPQAVSCSITTCPAPRTLRTRWDEDLSTRGACADHMQCHSSVGVHHGVQQLCIACTVYNNSSLCLIAAFTFAGQL